MKTFGISRLAVPPRQPLFAGFGKKIAAAFWLWSHPAAPQHVGMFAGSLLEYDSWAQPRPHH